MHTKYVVMFNITITESEVSRSINDEFGTHRNFEKIRGYCYPGLQRYENKVYHLPTRVLVGVCLSIVGTAMRMRRLDTGGGESCGLSLSPPTYYICG